MAKSGLFFREPKELRDDFALLQLEIKNSLGTVGTRGYKKALESALRLMLSSFVSLEKLLKNKRSTNAINIKVELDKLKKIITLVLSKRNELSGLKKMRETLLLINQKLIVIQSLTEQIFSN